MSYCSNCGNHLSSIEKFCPNCGMKITININNLSEIIQQENKQSLKIEKSIIKNEYKSEIQEKKLKVRFLNYVYYFSVLSTITTIISIFYYKSQQELLTKFQELDYFLLGNYNGVKCDELIKEIGQSYDLATKFTSFIPILIWILLSISYLFIAIKTKKFSNVYFLKFLIYVLLSAALITKIGLTFFILGNQEIHFILNEIPFIFSFLLRSHLDFLFVLIFLNNIIIKAM